jgi:hypothetical protein
MPTYRYICANNPEHLFVEATPDFWCPLCDISTHPMLKPYTASSKEAEPIVEIAHESEASPVIVKEKKTEKPKVLKKPEEVPNIRLGNQIWMKNSLTVKIFSDGTPIFHASSVKDWLAAKANRTPAWCFAADGHGDEMGILYNFYSVTHPLGLAPTGWDIPTLNDIKELTQEHGKLFLQESMGYEGLVDVCHRLPMGTFVEAMRKRTCWTKTSKINYTAHSFTVFAETGKIQVQLFDKNAGYFIRCIQKVG